MPAGRPSEYNPMTHPAIAESLARKGLTNTEIAEGMGISRATLTIWQREYPELLAAIKEGKATPDDNVEKSLYQRALGYEYTETKVIQNEYGEVVKTEITTKQVAPDVGAQCMWLKNRRSADWRDKQDIEHSGKISFVSAKDLTDDELAEIAARGKQ